jgi:hypothetical protein
MPDNVVSQMRGTNQTIVRELIGLCQAGLIRRRIIGLQQGFHRQGKYVSTDDELRQVWVERFRLLCADCDQAPTGNSLAIVARVIRVGFVIGNIRIIVRLVGWICILVVRYRLGIIGVRFRHDLVIVSICARAQQRTHRRQHRSASNSFQKLAA